jgi:2-aminoadipate transaminase
MKTTRNTFSTRAEQVPTSFIREILKAAGQDNTISLAGGLPEPSIFPKEQLAKSAYRVLMNHGHEALQYTNTEGYMPLRRFIAERYTNQQGIKVSPEQVLITSGSQQALDLISKLFLDPGNAIAVERPTYLGALQCFSQYEPRVNGVDLLENGPDEEQLRTLLEKEQPKFFYTIPNYQNPTGRLHSANARKMIAQLIGRSNTYIIEDDPYGEIRYEGDLLPTLHSLLPDKTILMGSFSKIIAPGLRVGWIIATPEIITRLAVLKQASDLHSSHVDQQVIYDYLTHNNVQEHLQQIIAFYKSRRDTMKEALDEYFPANVKYLLPNGGMFFWIEFPATINAFDLLNRCLKKGILFVPGETFYQENPSLHRARFNFSNTSEAKIRVAIKEIGCIIEDMEQRAIPAFKYWAVP